MAIDKLFHALVLGGVSMGVQACTPKKSQTKEPIETSSSESVDTQKEEKTEETPQEKTEETSSSAVEESGKIESQETLPAPRERKNRMEINSKGEKCADVCTEESSGEVICSEMCCWLTAVECCPNYRPPPEEEK